jgi:hypothetical protein
MNHRRWWPILLHYARVAKKVSCHMMANALSPKMTLHDFVNGYWYLDQLKSFAERIGIPTAKKLRRM